MVPISTIVLEFVTILKIAFKPSLSSELLWKIKSYFENFVYLTQTSDCSRLHVQVAFIALHSWSMHLEWQRYENIFPCLLVVLLYVRQSRSYTSGCILREQERLKANVIREIVLALLTLVLLRIIHTSPGESVARLNVDDFMFVFKLFEYLSPPEDLRFYCPLNLCRL